MKHYAELDVWMKETSVCIVDETGRMCREMKVPSHPEDLARALQDPAWQLVCIGLEAGPLSQWLFSGLADAGLPIVCIETRHTKAFLKAQVNKSDRNGARGIAQMMRVNEHEHAPHALQKRQKAVPVLHIRWGHIQPEHQAQRVDDEVPLLAFDLLGRVIADRIDVPPPFSALLTLWLSTMAAVGEA